ncbi:MAG: helix-turn-helix transcriptional regulator [Actinomycetota bacterium]|nr:helix-turn-helix transcriptional regulator [Actinomycetota bacterium]
MTDREEIEDKPVYMISVAAKLTGMHPQTLRIYERKQLLTPGRTPKSTRLYSQRDIRRLKLIQQLTHEEGVNLAGVKLIIELQSRLEAVERNLTDMEERIIVTETRLTEETAKFAGNYRREIVLIPKGVLVRGGRRE